MWRGRDEVWRRWFWSGRSAVGVGEEDGWNEMPDVLLDAGATLASKSTYESSLLSSCALSDCLRCGFPKLGDSLCSAGRVGAQDAL